MPSPEKTTPTNRPVPEQKASKNGFFSHEGNSLFSRSGEGFFNRKSDTFFGKQRVQPKLSVNEPGDSYEKEADAVADKVMRSTATAPAAPPAKNKEEELQAKEEDVQAKEISHVPPVVTPLHRKEEEDKLQAKGEAAPDVTPSFEQGLQSTKGGGSPLPDGVKQQMEGGIGADFSNVRVHTGSHAAQLNSSIQAQAFTHGNDIYFNEGKYSPGTDSGKHLLAHELTHTVQQGAAGVQRQVQRAPDPDVLINGKPITVWLDADGDITSKELKMVLQVQETGLIVTFSHKAGKKTHTVKLNPANLNLAKGVWAEQAGTTDGIRPLLVPLLGYKASDKTGKAGDHYYMSIVPGGKPGKYGFAGGSDLTTSALPKGIQYFDLGVPETYATDKRHKTLEEDMSPKKLGDVYRLSFIAGPQYNLSAALNIVPYPDDNKYALCYFETELLGEKRGIQQSPSSGSKISIPVPFDSLKIEKLEENNGYISYRFSPLSQAGFVVTYQMASEKQSKPDVNNAAHGFSIYNLGADNRPQGIKPEAGMSFGRAGGEWQYGYTARTEANFKIESGKEAFDKIAKTKLPDNETQSLLNEMGQIVGVAVNNNITSRAVYEEWLGLSLAVAAYYTGSKSAPDRDGLKLQMDQFITNLTKEIGSTGSEHFAGGGMHGSVSSTRNKYTGEEDTYHSGEFSATSTHYKPFEGPRGMAASGNFGGALRSLRSSYYLFVSDKLVHNSNGDKNKKEQLRSYGFRMEYDNNLREQLQKEKGTLKKISAFYYPDQGNLTGEDGSVKFVGSSTVAVPLDLYYKLDGNEWVLYNFTTLAEPGKLNSFERRRARVAGEEAPPQAIFDELTYDKGVGLGYIHYQTDKGTGGVVRVDHPWTIGEVLMTIGAIIGVLALALTGVGLVVEGVAATAVVVGDIAAVTIAAGTVIKLGESYMHGEPIGAGMLATAAFDIAIAILPAVRLMRGIGTLAKAGEDLYIIKQLDAALDSRLLKKLNIAANTGAIIVTTGEGAVELQKLSEALDKGLIDESTFYWAVTKYVGMGMLNVVMLHNDVKSLNAEPKVRLPKEQETKLPGDNKSNNNNRNQFHDEFIDTPENLPGSGKVPEKYPKLSWLMSSSKGTVLDATETAAFERALMNADDEVLRVINNFEDPNDFIVLMKGFKDNPAACEASFKSVSGFSGKYGWFTYWKKTPDLGNSTKVIEQLKSENKLLNTGEATDQELAMLHSFTVNGDFVNQPMRYNPSYKGAYSTNAIEVIKQMLDKLRAVKERNMSEKTVFSGRTFSKEEFTKTFVGNKGKEIPFEGFVSSSLEKSVAEGFIKLSAQWAGDGEKMGVIRRIVTKKGVYVDDISDWGKNLGKQNHSKADPSVQVQEEVLMNEGYFLQTSEPVPVMENGSQKMIDGVPLYYVDFVELVKPITK